MERCLQHQTVSKMQPPTFMAQARGLGETARKAAGVEKQAQAQAWGCPVFNSFLCCRPAGWSWVGTSDLLDLICIIHKMHNSEAHQCQKPVGESVDSRPANSRVTCRCTVTHHLVYLKQKGFQECGSFSANTRKVQDKPGLLVTLCVFKHSTTTLWQG